MKKFIRLLLIATIFALPSFAEEEPRREPAQQGVNVGSRPVFKTRYFGFGPALMSNANVTGVGIYVSGAYGFETDSVVIRIRLDVGGRGGSIMGDAGLGVLYFLIDTDQAPFVGIDFGYGIARIKSTPNETTNGFVFGGVAGVQILRSAAINLEIAFRLAVMLEKTSFGHPVLGGLRMGLYF